VSVVDGRRTRQPRQLLGSLEELLPASQAAGAGVPRLSIILLTPVSLLRWLDSDAAVVPVALPVQAQVVHLLLQVEDLVLHRRHLPE
jgi:hypothetical protein